LASGLPKMATRGLESTMITCHVDSNPMMHNSISPKIQSNPISLIQFIPLLTPVVTC
jgi:hypothetical protein